MENEELDDLRVFGLNQTGLRKTLINYDEFHFEEKELVSIEDCFEYKNKPSITWINIDGLYETELVEKLGRYFDLHPLTLEDISSSDQRPKVEDFTNYIFIILKMLYFDGETNKTVSEQLCIVVTQNILITFQEKPGDIFDLIRNKLKNNKGRIRKMASDYLAYSLIDAIVDNYFVILEKIGEKIDFLEEELITNPTQNTLIDIYELKREVLYLLKSVWPLRTILTNLEKEGSPIINDSTRIFFKDVYDHTIQVIDSIEQYRESLAEMLNIYVSSLGNKTNTVMKILTIFATVLMPLNVITGFYGMNFEFMPGLHNHWGFFGVVVLMVIASTGMLYLFKKKNWI